MSKPGYLFLIFLGLLLVAATGLAKDKPGKAKKAARETTSTESVASKPVVEAKWAFSEEERRVVQGYVRSYAETARKPSKQLPPGLSKKIARGAKLPPGWQRKCVPGEFMPAEVYEQCHALPPELVVKMPPAPEPTLTVTIGGKVIRLLKATREILDVFDVNVKL